MSLSEPTMRPADAGEADVFISYSRHDAGRVLELEKLLLGWGVSVWRDTEDIAVASSWSKQIVTAIKSCKVFLLVASNDSFESENVAKEIDLASTSKRVLMPVYLEPVELPDAIAYQLAGIQHVELFGENEQKALRQIKKGLRAHGVTVKGDGGSMPAAPPAAPAAPVQRKRPGPRALVLAASAALALAAAAVLVPGLLMASTKLTVEPPPYAFARQSGNRVVILDEAGNVVHEIAEPPFVFNPIVRDGDKVLGGQGAQEPVRLGADGAFRVELRAANDAPLAARTVDAGELAGRIVFGKSDVLGATLEVRIPAGDDALRRAGWRVLLRSSDGTNVHELVGSGSDAAVFTPVVTVLEPASDDRQRPVGEPIVLGSQDKYQVHVYRSGDDTSAGNGRYYYPFEQGLLPAALLDASPLDVSEYGNKRFGSD